MSDINLQVSSSFHLFLL